MKKKLYIVIILILTCLLTFTPEIGAKAVSQALLLAVKNVIPSIFPFLVLSGIAVRGGLLSILSGIFAPVSKLLGLSKTGGGAFLLGNLCGFPVGASISSSLYENGAVSAKEAQRLSAVSNNVSTGFAVAFAGVSVMGSKSIGVALYACQFIAAIIVCAATRSKNTYKNDTANTAAEGNIFINSVISAAVASLNISAFVAVFSVISSYITVLFDAINSPALVSAVVSSILEISSGCSISQGLPFYQKIAVVSFAVGFSGVSVICQSASFLNRSGLAVFPVFMMKLFQGILTSFLCVLYVRIFPESIETVSMNVSGNTSLFSPLISLLIIVLFIFSLARKGKTLDL